MKRDFLIKYLEGEGCYPAEDHHSDVSELWINCINSESCYIPFEDELALTTYCHIIYELKVDPPVEYDADYHVYVGWRENQLKMEQPKSKN
jgi:hypothetical protein